MKFTEAQLESTIDELLGVEGYPQVLAEAIYLSAGQAGRQLVSRPYKFLANSKLAGISKTKELTGKLLKNGKSKIPTSTAGEGVFPAA